jgi:amidase
VPAWNPSGTERAVGAQLMAVSGPMARSISDIRLSLAAMAAEDLRDPWWVPAPLNSGPFPKRAALCVRPEGLNTKPEVERALRDAALRLQNAGWSIVETPCPPLRAPAALQAMLWLAESRRGLNAALEREADPDASFVFAQMEALCPKPDLDSFQDALQARAGFTRQWQAFLKNYPVLLVPVSAELPFPDLLDVESPEAFRRVIEAQLVQVGLPLMGLPGLTVATGAAEGVPVGVQLIGGRYREDVLLEAGALIEAGGLPVSVADPR